MQQLIIKKDISQSKLKALINFLKSWDIEAEIIPIEVHPINKNPNLSLSVGLWKDNSVDATELRKQAWNRSK